MAGYSDVFEGMGSLTSGYEYKLTGTVKENRYSPPARRVPAAIMPKLQQELKKLTGAGIIEPTT